MAEIRIGINGFGRVGRCLLKILLENPRFRVVGLNDMADLGDLAYLLKYDSVHGWYPPKVEHREQTLHVGRAAIPFLSVAAPGDLPWGDLGAEIVFECTGAFRPRDRAAAHLSAGARRVIISAPSDDADATLVPGVNAGNYDPARHQVVSMASCTTNSLAPVAKVLLESFGVEHIMISTVHAYTSSQSLTDLPTRKRRRGRAAALSIVPTTTGAARATSLVLPELAGKVDGLALRVPVPDGSVTDIVARLATRVDRDQVNEALATAAARPPLEGILRVTHEALVSRDILGDPHSSIVDAQSTMVLDGTVVKLLAWYDNEWGYAARLADLAVLMAG